MVHCTNKQDRIHEIKGVSEACSKERGKNQHGLGGISFSWFVSVHPHNIPGHKHPIASSTNQTTITE